MKTSLRVSAGALAIIVATPLASAGAQVWASWNGPTTCATSPNTITGTMGATNVSISGAFNGYQLATGQNCGGPLTTAGGQGTSYFYANNNLGTPYTAYTSGGTSAPLEFGLVQYNASVSQATITFSSAVIDPYIAFVSMGQTGQSVTYDFLTSPFTVISHNTGFTSHWGPGTHSVLGNTLTGVEFSGILRFSGSYTSITFNTTNSEFWHGITVGAQSVVPEPSTYLLMASGLLVLGILARRRQA